MKPIFPAALLILFLTGCGTTTSLAPSAPKSVASKSPEKPVTDNSFSNEPNPSPLAREVVMYALMLLETGYKFGGKNPSAGLDCSGLISVVFKNAVNIPLEGNAATMATKGKEVARHQLRAGDLVFFNTMNRPFSHVGLYIGNSKFVHAPNSRGKVRVEKLTTKYWSQRFEMGRTLLG